jgi:DNA-binding PadR family transcriptional regulator
MTGDQSVDVFTAQIKSRFTKDFLDLLILRLVESEPVWGYYIMKKIMVEYGIMPRHGALYPLLNNLEKDGFISSTREMQKGRQRKVYKITEKGKKLLRAYHDFLKEQISANQC